MSAAGPRAMTARIAALLPATAALLALACQPKHEAPGHQLFLSPQVNPIALSPAGERLYVACTTSNRVEILDTTDLASVASVPVGIEPVALALRPGTHELWVSNHVSDSLSVLDVDPASPTYLQTLDTVQMLWADGSTAFDEPVGIAFTANGSKAYVALSSRDRVAVIHAASRTVTNLLEIEGQDPRALVVQRASDSPGAPELLFVASFESGNGSELSICDQIDGTPQCTLRFFDFVLFSIGPTLAGRVKNIVVDPVRPDWDVFVFDTSSDAPLPGSPVRAVGTLLYGITGDGRGGAFVAATDARNTRNGIEGSDPNRDGATDVEDLENRVYANRIAHVDCASGSCVFDPVADVIDLDAGETPLATPYGVAASPDGSTLVLTAAASRRLATLDLATGSIASVEVRATPRGVALRSDASGAASVAYVLNTLDNSVSAVDVSQPEQPVVVATTSVGTDPTPEDVRLGNVAFNDARLSASGSFACASCHPDGHTDQTLWRIGGECSLPGCEPGVQNPRLTRPLRGLRDTLPLHWDGTLGDPFGGPNGAVGAGGSVPAQCDAGDPHGCFRQLVDASLAGLMCVPGGCDDDPVSELDRDRLATFLERIAPAPPRGRPADDLVSEAGRRGFQDFFTERGGHGDDERATCADGGCHELPLGASTNGAEMQGFDAPSLRGLPDRFVQFSLGITGAQEFVQNFTSWDPASEGPDEFKVFAAAFPPLLQQVYGVFPTFIFLELLEEASTGYAGALGRQLTLSSHTTADCPDCEVEAWLALLEAADARGVVNLRGSGSLGGMDRVVSYVAADDRYRVGKQEFATRSELIAWARAGTLLVTLTAELPADLEIGDPQPLLAPACGAPNGVDPALPVLEEGEQQVQLRGWHVPFGSEVFVDGENWSQTHGASVASEFGAPPCAVAAPGAPATPLRIELGTAPEPGFYLLQVRSVDRLLSNELPFFVQ